MKEIKIDKYIGNRFKELREQNNMSLKDVSERIGIKKSAYYKYECGERSMPYTIIRKLGSLYEFDVMGLIA